MGLRSGATQFRADQLEPRFYLSLLPLPGSPSSDHPQGHLGAVASPCPHAQPHRLAPLLPTGGGLWAMHGAPLLTAASTAVVAK